MIDLSSLSTVVSDQKHDSEINIGAGGTLLDPLLTTLSRTDLSVDGLATVATAQITSITGSQVYASDGAVIAFPGVTALSTFSGANLTIQASGTSTTGTPSEIDLSHVTTLTGTTDNVYFFNAYSGGEIDLSNLASNPSGRNYFQVSGAGSVLDLSSLPSIVSDQNNDSLLSADSSGTILLSSGTVSVSRVDVSVTNAGTIQAGTLQFLPGSSLSGDGTVQANVVNAAAIDPGSGGTAVLTIDGNFTQYGAGTLNIELGGTTAGTQYDQLVVTGAVQLSGTIAISLGNNFVIQLGDQFSVITYASKSGEFSTYNGLGFAPDEILQTHYGTSAFTLVAAGADVRVFPTVGLYTSEAGDSTSFTVVLATEPNSNVPLKLSSSNTSAGLVSPSTLTFTPADWNVPQTVTVTGVNDNQSGSTPYQVVFAQVISGDYRYDGFQPTSVSLTNLPDEVENIAVTHVAVSPSTGLEPGSSFSVTWNDSNTGNLPASAVWDDQVVITNTTTGDTLITALVPINPAVVGVLNSGSSLAEQYVHALLSVPTDRETSTTP